MLKLMLVDDEPIIRKGIRTSINWENYGIEISEEASNGREALEKALEIKPQILITDIRMPVMDGLELSKLLKKELPDTRIIILSGYDDFAYAREAISLGVYEYLLKPVGAEDLISVVIKMKDEIVKEEVNKNRTLSAKIVLNENFLLIKSNFINRIIRGELKNENSILEQIRLLKLNLPGPENILIVIDIDDFLILCEDLSDKDKELLRFSVVNICEEVLLASFSGLICYSEFEHMIGIISGKTLEELLIQNLCRNIQFCVKKYLNLSVTIGISNTSRNIVDISKLYSEALLAMRNKIYKGKSSILQFKDIKNSTVPTTLVYPTDEEKEIINQLKTLNLNGLNTLIKKIFASFISGKADIDNIKNVCIRLIVIAMSCVQDMGIDIQNGLGASFQPYREMEKYDVVVDLQNWVESVFSKLVNLIQDNKTTKFKVIIRLVLKYIEDNYQKDLKLVDIANIVYVTPNYLSRIFKEEMGTNFVDWLNLYRIEKAKLLLREAGVKTYEVAEKVGYSDYKYFSYIFKKCTGVTPREYREQM